MCSVEQQSKEELHEKKDFAIHSYMNDNVHLMAECVCCAFAHTYDGTQLNFLASIYIKLEMIECT